MSGSTGRPVDGLDAVQGVWRRRWLRTPAGRDETTDVRWMQAGDLHVDVRVPAELAVDEPPYDPANPDADRLRLLAACEGFAGTTAVHAGVCTWTRRINYRGPAHGVDAGTLRLGPHGLLETGIHDDYEELWTHESAEAASGACLRGPGGQWLVVLWTDERFALGRGRPADMALESPLGERVKRAVADRDVAALGAAFDQEFCTGRVRDGAGIVERSTLPGRGGAVAVDVARLAAGAADLTLAIADVFGATSSVVFERG